MIEWEIQDQERRGQPPAPDTPPPPGGRPRRGRWLLLLLLVVGLAGLLLVRRAQVREAQLRADLTARIEEESRAQAFGLTERATELADPDAPQAWQARYVAQFAGPRSFPTSRPVVDQIDWEGSRALVEVRWSSPPLAAERRAYRLVGGAWRRAPLPLPPPSATKVTQSSTYFQLRGSQENVSVLVDDPDLRLNLEALRSRVVTYWPNTWEDYFLTLYIEPQELSPAVYFADAQKFYVNTQPLTPVDPASPLPPKAQYRLAVTTAVVRWLTNPNWIRNLPEENPPDVSRVRDWMVLTRMLQEAEARYWALDGRQQRDLRNAWRSELGGVWPAPLAGPLPLDPDRATPDERRRWLLLNLIIERQVAPDRFGNPGRLARILQKNYPIEGFDPVAFFHSLGGSPASDLESSFADYVLTMEE